MQQLLSRADIDSAVTAVFRQPVYQNEPSLAKTLWQRLIDYIFEIIGRVLQAAAQLPHGQLIARLLFIAIILVAIGAIAYKLYSKSIYRRGEINLTGLNQTNWSSPWTMAQKLASEDKYTEAAHYLYAGLLRRTARSGYIVLHVSKTSGDYIRELRSRADREHARTFSEFVYEYEIAVYGFGSCDADIYNRLVTLASPFATQNA